MSTMRDLLATGLAQAGLLLSLVGLWVGSLTWTRAGRSLDRKAFRAINRLPELPVLDWAMWSITHLGSAWAGIAALTLAIVAGRSRFGLVIAASLLTVATIIGVAKALTQRRRPYVELAGVRVIGLRPVDLSYPSGHTTVAFNLATLLAFGLAPAWPGCAGLYLAAAAVGYSRLHLGVHYPSDVLAGAVFGTGWGLLWASFLALGGG